MLQSIVHIALVVNDYDEAIEFYTKKLHFTLVEDTYQPEQDKRWVVVSPPGTSGTTILLARASKPEQIPFVGNQAGGRIFLFLGTDDFWRDYNDMIAQGIEFVRKPKEQDYGTVAVFTDLYGNLWDLVQFNENHPMYKRVNGSLDELTEALRAVVSVIHKCEKAQEKFPGGTSHHTLLKNRLKAMYISKALIEEALIRYNSFKD